jgi:hypothetical protein
MKIVTSEIEISSTKKIVKVKVVKESERKKVRRVSEMERGGHICLPNIDQKIE